MNPQRLFALAILACLQGSLSTTAASPARNAVLPLDTVIIDAARGPVRFAAEIAADQESQEKGLMYRTRLAPDAGMLFDFHSPEPQTFWMKNTVLPLDMIFIRGDGIISSIAPNAVPYSETPIPSTEPVRAVLEINGGRAAALEIEPGQRVHSAIFGNSLPGRK